MTSACHILPKLTQWRATIGSRSGPGKPLPPARTAPYRLTLFTHLADINVFLDCAADVVRSNEITRLAVQFAHDTRPRRFGCSHLLALPVVPDPEVAGSPC